MKKDREEKEEKEDKKKADINSEELVDIIRAKTDSVATAVADALTQMSGEFKSEILDVKVQLAELTSLLKIVLNTASQESTPCEQPAAPAELTRKMDPVTMREVE